jgi:hypothetical protein
VNTNRTTQQPNNKEDIIIRGNDKGTCLSVDTAISGLRNVTKIEAAKLLIYKDLTTKTAIWN